MSQREACSVCFFDHYLQNIHFICNHPLCQNCYEKLTKKICPICRSPKQHPYYQVTIGLNRHDNYVYVQATRLKDFCLYSTQYKKFMNKFLLERKKPSIYEKANRYRRFYKFIIEKAGFLDLQDMHEFYLFDYILNRKFSTVNTKIIKSYLMYISNSLTPYDERNNS
jgi:predicted amidophosphoribosyltransferase